MYYFLLGPDQVGEEFFLDYRPAEFRTGDNRIWLFGDRSTLPILREKIVDFIGEHIVSLDRCVSPGKWLLEVDGETAAAKIILAFPGVISYRRWV